MLRRLDALTGARRSFGFETTLASRSLAPRIYRPLTTTWRVYDNSADTPRLVASGAGARTMTVEAPEIWQRIRAEVGHEGQD